MAFYRGTKQQCEEYNSIVTKGEGYSGGTVKWDDAREIEGIFYITAHPEYPCELTEVQFLPEEQFL